MLRAVSAIMAGVRCSLVLRGWGGREGGAVPSCGLVLAWPKHGVNIDRSSILF